MIDHNTALKLNWQRITLCVVWTWIIWFAWLGTVRGADIDVKLKASVGQRYDDNVTNTNVNQQEDFITTFKVGTEIQYQNRRTQADFQADLIHQLFWDESDNNNTSQRANFSIQHQLTKFDNILISDTFSHTFDPNSFDEEFARGSGRVRYYRNRFDFAYVRDVSPKLQVKFGYGHDLDQSNRDDRLDSMVNRFQVESTYVVNSERQLFLTYDFLNRNLDPGGDANIHSVTAGLRQYLTEQLYVEGRAGIDFIDGFDGQSSEDPLWVLTLHNEFSETGSTYLTYTQRNSTNPYNSAVFDSWQLSWGLEQQWMRRLSGTFAAFYGEGEYADFQIEDEFMGMSLGFRFLIRRGWTADMSYVFFPDNVKHHEPGVYEERCVHRSYQGILKAG